MNPTPATSSTTIESIESIIVDLPTIRAHQLAMTTLHRQSLVIVRLRCADGSTGVGEATSIGGLAYGDQSPESTQLAIDTYLAPLLIGQDAGNVNAAMALMNRHVQGQSYAKSAIETALLDALGHRLGQPVHALLGGALRTSMPVLWTLASGDSARDVDEALGLMEARRHRVFKLKIGKGDPAANVAHVAHIKRALGDEVLITVDVNQAWDETTAQRSIAALEQAGVGLVEQPVARRHRAALARLAARFDVPIMADESINGPEDALELAQEAAADVFALKISKAGGLLNTLRTAAVAEAAGIGLYGGTLLEGSIGSIASAHAFAACPQLRWGTELFGPLLLKDDIVTARPDFRDFELHLTQAPGLGVSVDEDKLAFYRRDRQRTAVAVTA
ncbi:muconate/chloromuconate family cycloisomerase [Aquincola tertiaricarbonis]|uniref:Muconate/chloromuconate family cycloisomerase n=1 Tax=Aquincola tertiaricarbonis TaxID=391953 RepID=A0ABY4S4Y0_AQUTE|nr:muconate/chloromuconate family cycloisomerase [Aquincola tertiaricarbonis]URI08038.1 muconate/chloromuconate family cycloisomerase [Aquincola tertiaricarbonis]